MIVFVLLLITLWITPAQAGIVCDGVDDKTTSVTAIGTLFSDTVQTMSMWVKPTGTPPTDSDPFAGSAPLADGPGGNVTMFYRMIDSGAGSANHLGAANWDGTTVKIGSTYTVGSWSNIVLTKGGGNLCFYINGALVSCAASGALTNVTQVLVMCGGENAGGFPLPYQGSISAVFTWNVTLNAQEIASLGGSRLMWPQLTRQPTTAWLLDTCASGASLNGTTSPDRSGVTGNTVTFNDGTNNTGMSCIGSDLLSYDGGVD